MIFFVSKLSFDQVLNEWWQLKSALMDVSHAWALYGSSASYEQTHGEVPQVCLGGSVDC